jgi:putative transposase
MSNHVHLLATGSITGAIATMVQDLGRRYVRVFNTLHARTGTLWEGRYNSSLVDSERYLLACHRYIELNPVRADIVNHPGDYLWSSHAHYAHGRADSLITDHEAYRALGALERERQDAFRALVEEPLQQATIEAIRKAINSDSGFGSESFLDRVGASLGRSVRPPVRGRPAKPDEPERAAIEPAPVSGKLF